MTEARVWRAHVKPVLERAGKAVRVENPLHPGTFDVSWTLRSGEAGWLELKRVEVGWAIPSLTREQVVFGYEWARGGGRAFLLLRRARAREWWLFDGGALTRGRVEPALALAAWDRLDERLVEALRGRLKKG